MTWDQYASAAKMRDIVRRIATSVVDEMRPPDKVGRVVDIDRRSMTAWIVYAGDTTTTVRVKMIPGKQPQFADSIQGPGAGAIVRVSGGVGSRYITEIISQAPLMQYPRLFNSSMALGGGIEGSIGANFALSASGAPPADGSNYYTGILNFPGWGGQIDIQTVVKLASGKSWVSAERFQFDDLTTIGSDVTATMVAQSSTGMDLVTKFSIHDGADDGMPAGTAGLNVSLVRAATSTKSPVSAQVYLRCIGVDVRLVQELDGSLT